MKEPEVGDLWDVKLEYSQNLTANFMGPALVQKVDKSTNAKSKFQLVLAFIRPNLQLELVGNFDEKCLLQFLRKAKPAFVAH